MVAVLITLDTPLATVKPVVVMAVQLLELLFALQRLAELTRVQAVVVAAVATMVKPVDLELS